MLVLAYVSPREMCSVYGCESKPRSGRHHLCGMHYQRLKKTGEVGPARSLRPRNRGCVISDCTEKHYGKGFCQKHWQLDSRKGTPLWEKPIPTTAEIERRREIKRARDTLYQEEAKKNPAWVERRRESSREWAQRNRERGSFNSAKYQRRKRAFLDAFKLMVGCVDCGFDLHPAALDFDHVHEKKTTVAGGRLYSMGWRNLLAEIEKCEVRCANCHRVRTSQNWLEFGHPAGKLGVG